MFRTGKSVVGGTVIFSSVKGILVQTSDIIMQKCEASQSKMKTVGYLASIPTFFIAKLCNMASPIAAHHSPLLRLHGFAILHFPHYGHEGQQECN